jgi:hypothetical protein
MQKKELRKLAEMHLKKRREEVEDLVLILKVHQISLNIH